MSMVTCPLSGAIVGHNVDCRISAHCTTLFSPPLPAFALAEASVRTEHVSFSVLTALLICHVRLHAKMKHREILN
jgi:hypothetical protein